MTDIHFCNTKILNDSEFRKNLVRNGYRFLSYYMNNQGDASNSVALILKNLISKNDIY